MSGEVKREANDNIQLRDALQAQEQDRKDENRLKAALVQKKGSAVAARPADTYYRSSACGRRHSIRVSRHRVLGRRVSSWRDRILGINSPQGLARTDGEEGRPRKRTPLVSAGARPPG